MGTRNRSWSGITRACKLVVVLWLCVGVADAAAYSISYTGSATSETPEFMGLGMGHGTGNVYAWLKYLKPTSMRYFVTSIAQWKNFVTNFAGRGYPSQWGVSFSGAAVVDSASWQAAVHYVRQVSASPRQPAFLDWLSNEPSVQWSYFLNQSLYSPNATPFMRCLGAPQDVLNSLNALGVRILAVWHVTCHNLPLSTADASQAEYWRERWELYRWFYAGGRFLAANNVRDVELYNEPDQDASTCLPAAAWLDEYEIRSMALQQAYADHAAWSGQAVPLSLIAPPMSSPKFDPGTYGELAARHIHNTFPAGSSVAWKNQEAFSYHQYDTPGYGMRSAFDSVSTKMKAAGEPLPIYISEHNCFADSVAQQHLEVDIMDSPETAACVSGQTTAIVGRARWSSLQKATQTPSQALAGVTKNGVMWGDSGGGGLGSPGFCDIGGTTNTAEAYRLHLLRTPGAKQLYTMNTQPQLRQLSNFSMYTVASDTAYHVYLSNYDTVLQMLKFDFTRLRGVPASAPVVINAVTASLHGEVAAFTQLSAARTLSVTQPRSSLYMITVPRVAVASLPLPASDDTTLAAGNNMNTPAPGRHSNASITVQTSTTTNQDGTSVALLSFVPASFNPANTVSAVLQLTVAQSTGSGAQVLTVLGTPAPWQGPNATWSSVPALLLPQPTGHAMRSIATNFINWQDPLSSSSTSVVGHLTVPTAAKAGAVVSLDVTDYVRGGGTSFAVAHLWRFDAQGSGSAKLAGDSISGGVSFHSKDAASGVPVVRIVYAV